MASRDVGVGLRLDVGVNAQSYACPLAMTRGEAFEVLELGGRFDVEE